MKVPETVRIDPSGYAILEKYRQKLIKAGQPGASFSDAVRHMEALLGGQYP